MKVTYRRHGDYYLLGSDGSAYFHRKPYTPNDQAFSGAAIRFQLEDGGVVIGRGDWWATDWPHDLKREA